MVNLHVIIFNLVVHNIALIHPIIYTQEVLIHSSIISLFRYAIGHTTNPPTYTLRNCCFITSLVVHGRTANPPTYTLRGSAHSIILSIRSPTHLYVRKMWCNSFRTKLFLFLPDGNCFVSKSASFSLVLM